MRQYLHSTLAVGLSSIHGRGLFLLHPVMQHQMLIEYTGELIRFGPAPSNNSSIFICDLHCHLCVCVCVCAHTVLCCVLYGPIICCRQAATRRHPGAALHAGRRIGQLLFF